jgi:hypothetical protein
MCQKNKSERNEESKTRPIDGGWKRGKTGSNNEDVTE